MKRILAISVSLTLAASAFATVPLFENFGTITNARNIDATIIYNAGTFTNIQSTIRPYRFSNLRFFTNAPSGVMHGAVGFQFDSITNDTTRPLGSFFNDSGATITAVDSGLEFDPFLGPEIGTASYVKVAATNLVSHGNLSVGSIGLLQLTGNYVDLSRGSVSAGQLAAVDQTNFFGLFGGVNSYGVLDIYGGAGEQVIDLAGGDLGFFPPFPVYSPDHLVQLRSGPGGIGGGQTFLAQLPVPQPGLVLPEFEAHALVTDIAITPTGVNKYIQVVFVRTNFADTNLSADVRFGSSRFVGQGFSAMVEFSTPAQDSITGETVTNAVYLIDRAAEFGSISAFTNIFGNSSVRPSNYEVRTLTPAEWLFGTPANTAYDPNLLFPGDVYVDDEVEAEYAGYAVQVGRNPELVSGVTSYTNNFGIIFNDLNSLLIFPDPTNQPGRVEINADVLDLSLARIRAEGLLTLNAKHLTGGGAFDISAGIIEADLGTTNGVMVVSNIFPSHFKRVRGDIYAYSAIWTNRETNSVAGFTNNNRFHVLIVDHNLKADFTPTIRDLTLRSTNLTIKDDLTLNRTFRLVTENLTFGGNMEEGATNVITVVEDAVDVRAPNLVGIKNFINESNSIFQGADDAYFGYDVPEGWNSIINRGFISATAPLFKSTTFQNSGSIVAENGGSIVIRAGTVELVSSTNQADRSVHIFANNLIATNSTIIAGTPGLTGVLELGQLILNVTNLITDFGPGANNVWQVSDGFVLNRKPFQGDLLGTEIRTIAEGFNEALHVWAGEDAGPGPDGFVNNVAIGHLILDLRSPNAKLRFRGAGFQNGLYVVNLDFNVSGDINIDAQLNSLMQIDENLRIYYINSNAGDKLMNAFPGRVIQVENFNFVGGASPLVVRANGLGIVTPNLNGKNLEVGREYKVRAIPGAGQIFTGWTGGTNANVSSLTFEMRRNLVLQANFTRNPLNDLKGAYNGLFFDSVDGVTHESSGFINFNVTKNGLVTGKIVSGKSYRLKGAFDPNSGLAEITVPRGPGKTPFVVTLQLDLLYNSGEVTGTVNADGWTSELQAHLAKSNPPVSKKDRFTMSISGNADAANAPAGHGYATIHIDGSGNAHFKGALADGSKINQRVAVSRTGKVPFYLSLYRGEGSLVSWIQFTNSAFSSMSGDVSWFKKEASGGMYPAGFTNAGTIAGSKYLPPSDNVRVLDILQGTVTLAGGNLGVEQVTTITLDTENKFTVIDDGNDLSLSVSLPSGLLKGSFVHPETQKKTSIQGVVLQQQNDARGFFLGTDQSGSVTLESD